jgi:hypothetical protein
MPDKQRRPVRKLKKILFFLQLCHLLSSSCFLFFDNNVFPNSTCSKVEYFSSTYAPDSGSGASLVSTLLLKLTALLRHGWSGAKKHRCAM